MPERESVKFEIYGMLEGKGQVIVSFADGEHSIGVMTLNPGRELSAHTRPVDEQLVQLVAFQEQEKINSMVAQKTQPDVYTEEEARGYGRQYRAFIYEGGLFGTYPKEKPYIQYAAEFIRGGGSFDSP